MNGNMSLMIDLNNDIYSSPKLLTVLLFVIIYLEISSEFFINAYAPQQVNIEKTKDLSKKIEIIKLNLVSYSKMQITKLITNNEIKDNLLCVSDKKLDYINYEKQEKVKILYWMLEDSNNIKIEYNNDMQIIYGDMYYKNKAKKDKYKKKVFKDILKDTQELYVDKKEIMEYKSIALITFRKVKYNIICIILFGFLLNHIFFIYN
jgi:hypothetical protein